MISHDIPQKAELHLQNDISSLWVWLCQAINRPANLFLSSINGSDLTRRILWKKER